jgi:hypothetical protein
MLKSSQSKETTQILNTLLYEPYKIKVSEKKELGTQLAYEKFITEYHFIMGNH